MAFRCRKLAAKLRRLAISFGFSIPLPTTAPAWWLGEAGGLLLALASLVSGILGIAMERWLFFAEARHAVMLYYGEASA